MEVAEVPKRPWISPTSQIGRLSFYHHRETHRTLDLPEIATSRHADF
jgi:hypothetical protein